MKKTRGFTLAEVLITLAIIGIVAAITLPSLLVNVNEKAWDAQRKALHARLAQAIGQMNTLGGYGTFETNEEGTATVDTAAESFILDALSKVYKINNVCGPDKLSSCGIPSKVATLDGALELNFPTKMSELNPALLQNIGNINSSEGSIVDTKAAAFETVNGESVAIFYNPYCGNESSVTHYIQNKMCANMIYDLNGKNGPNKVGEDIGFISIMYNKNSVVVAPNPYKTNYPILLPQYNSNKETMDAAKACSEQDENLRLPNKDEAATLFINQPLFNLQTGLGGYWSSSVISRGEDGKAWLQAVDTGYKMTAARNLARAVRCVYK